LEFGISKFGISYVTLSEVEELGLGPVSCCPLYLLRRTPAQKDAAPIRARALGFIRRFLFKTNELNKFEKIRENSAIRGKKTNTQLNK